jgi:hypothetical protein
MHLRFFNNMPDASETTVTGDVPGNSAMPVQPAIEAV